MSQFDFGTIDPNSKSGPQLALDLNKFRDALNSAHRGSARPAYAQAGMLWVKETSSTQWDLMLFDGDNDFVIRSVNPTTNQVIKITTGEISGLGTAATATLTTTSTDTTAGRVLKVSDFGVGAQLAVGAESLDAESFTRFRAYGTNTTGAPTTNGGAAIVISRGTAPTIIAIDYVTGEIYYRPAGSAQAWGKLFSSRNVSAFIQTLFDDADAATARATLGVVDAIGQGQTWQNVTASRVANTTYTNSTGRTIGVLVTSSTGSTTNYSVNGAVIATSAIVNGGKPNTFFLVPPGGTYGVGNADIERWMELRA